MKEPEFIQICKGNEDQFHTILPYWINFIKELDSHRNRETPEELMIRDLTRRVNIQGSRPDMHFEICRDGSSFVGFVNYAVDLGTIYGLLEAGYGTVMGLYIVPRLRRRGYGNAVFRHVQNILQADGANRMYVCPDSVTGAPFWSAMGFSDSGKVDPDDKLPIYIKDIL